MADDEIETRFAALESKLAHLEYFVSRLQDQVIERNAAVDRLAADHSAVKEKLLQMAAELEEMPNQRPPHY